MPICQLCSTKCKENFAETSLRFFNTVNNIDFLDPNEDNDAVVARLLRMNGLRVAGYFVQRCFTKDQQHLPMDQSNKGNFAKRADIMVLETDLPQNLLSVDKSYVPIQRVNMILDHAINSGTKPVHYDVHTVTKAGEKAMKILKR